MRAITAAVYTAFFFFSLVSVSLAANPNLLLNGNFDFNITSWSIGSQEFITISHSASDVDGSPGSGSLEMNPAVTGWASQCVSVTGGDSYLLSGYITPLSGSAAMFDFSLEVAWNDAQSCAGSATGTPNEVVAPSIDDTWHLVTDTIAAPAGALSAEVRLKATKKLGGNAFARFDAIYLPEPSANPMLLATGLSLFAIRLRKH